MWYCNPKYETCADEAKDEVLRAINFKQRSKAIRETTTLYTGHFTNDCKEFVTKTPLKINKKFCGKLFFFIGVAEN